MSQINVTDRDKERFDEFKDSDQTQAEAFAEVMDIVQAFEGEPVDVEKLADELKHSMIPQTEVAAYRGAKEAVEGSGE